MPRGTDLLLASDPMEPRVAALEEIVAGSVAITARAIAEAAPEMTLLQWRVVVVVGRERDGLAVRDLAARTGLSSSALSRLVGRLVGKSLVSRAPGERDRRLTVVRLTDEGRELLERVVATRARVLEDIAASPAVWAGDPLVALGEEFGRRA